MSVLEGSGKGIINIYQLMMEVCLEWLTLNLLKEKEFTVNRTKAANKTIKSFTVETSYEEVEQQCTANKDRAAARSSIKDAALFP